MRGQATALFVICLLCVTSPLYAQAPLIPSAEPPLLKPQETNLPTKDLPTKEVNINTQEPIKEEQPALEFNHKLFKALYNKPKVEEKKKIRKEWEKTIGVDVWYPYFKAKEVEDWVRDRFSVRIFNMKGRPKFERDRISYTFSSKF